MTDSSENGSWLAFTFHPNRQRIDPNVFWPAIGRVAEFGLVAACLWLLWLSAESNEIGILGLWGVLILAGVCTFIAVGLLISVVLLRMVLIGVHLWSARKRRKSISYDDSSVTIHTADQEYVNVPYDAIYQVYVRMNGERFNGVQTGFGIVFNDLSGLKIESRTRNDMERMFGRIGCHLWLAAPTIGNDQQNREFLEWLNGSPLSRYIQLTSEEEKLPLSWPRQEWFVLVLLLVLFAGGIYFWTVGAPS